jgi:membrane protease YdiL (CAAX protease family)
MRLCASILLGMIGVGGVGDPLLRVASEPWTPNALPVLGWGLAAVISLGAGIWLLRRPLPRERILRNFLFLVTSVYAGLLFIWLNAEAAERLAPGTADGPSSALMVLSVLGFQGLALALVGRSLREFELSWTTAFGFGNAPVLTLGVGVLVGILFTPFAWALQAGIALVMENLSVDAVEQTAVEVLRTAESTDNRVILGIAAVLIAPIAEEVLFRDILYPFVKQRGFPRLALWITSVMFASIHLNVVAFVPLVVLAVVLTLLYEKTGNLLAPISAHMAFNAVNLGVLYSLH